MRIGFDLDGVVLDQDTAMLRFIDLEDSEEKRNTLAIYYYLNRKTQLNPLDYLDDGDELYFITGRNIKYKEITESWKNKYFPLAKLVVCNHSEPVKETVLEDWFKSQARVKAKYLREYKIDVYFEDCPEVVRHLRTLCPEISIIKYGGRFPEP